MNLRQKVNFGRMSSFIKIRQKRFLEDDSKYQYILFFIWPFFSFINSIINFRNRNSRNIIWFFTAFFGFSMVIQGDISDASRFAQAFPKMAGLSFSEIFGNLYKDSDSLDIYESLLNYSISRFTSNWRIYYAIVALIFGYFYSRNIWYLLDRINWRITKIHALFILAFSFIVAIYSFQFVRFHTASVVFMFGALPFIFERNRKKLFWTVIAIFIHFTFIFPLALLAFYTLLPKKTEVYFVLFIFSSFIYEIKLSVLTSFMTGHMPSALLQDKVDLYGNENYATSVKEATETLNWYILYRSQLFTYLIYSLVIYIFITQRNRLLSIYSYRCLFAFSLLLYSAGNFVSVMPSGSRFVGVAQLFMFSFFIFTIGKMKLTFGLQIIYFLASFILTLYSIVGIRYAIEIMGFVSFFGNPILALFVDETVPIIEYIKRLL